MIFKKNEPIVVAQKVEEDKLHIISFVGQERADILYFLAKILEQYHDDKGYRSVLLVDNSNTKDLYHIFDQQDTGMEEITRNRVTVTKDAIITTEYAEQFSYIIYYHGMDADKEILAESELVIAQTDYLPATYTQLKGALDDCEDIHFIFRDWRSKKVKESYVESEIGISNDKIQMRSIIKANDADDLAYFNLCHNGKQKLGKANLSELYTETLRYFVEKITGADEKAIQKLLKKSLKY